MCLEITNLLCFLECGLFLQVSGTDMQFTLFNAIKQKKKETKTSEKMLSVQVDNV